MNVWQRRGQIVGFAEPPITRAKTILNYHELVARLRNVLGSRLAIGMLLSHLSS